MRFTHDICIYNLISSLLTQLKTSLCSYCHRVLQQSLLKLYFIYLSLLMSDLSLVFPCQTTFTGDLSLVFPCQPNIYWWLITGFPCWSTFTGDLSLVFSWWSTFTGDITGFPLIAHIYWCHHWFSLDGPHLLVASLVYLSDLHLLVNYHWFSLVIHIYWWLITGFP